jgi:hypothetical protein
MDKPLEPVAPTWETQAAISLSTRSYTVADLLARDLIHVPGNLGTFSLSSVMTGRLFADTVSLGDSSDSGQGHTLVDQKTAADFNSLKIHVVIDNAIPLQFAVKLQFLDGMSRLLINVPQAAGDSITAAAPVDLGGTVPSPSHTERSIDLAHSQIQQFNNTYSLAYFLVVSTVGTNLSTLELTQAIKIRVWVELSYQVNK